MKKKKISSVCNVDVHHIEIRQEMHIWVLVRDLHEWPTLVMPRVFGSAKNDPFSTKYNLRFSLV